MENGTQRIFFFQKTKSGYGEERAERNNLGTISVADQMRGEGGWVDEESNHRKRSEAPESGVEEKKAGER